MTSLKDVAEINTEALAEVVKSQDPDDMIEFMDHVIQTASLASVTIAKIIDNSSSPEDITNAMEAMIYFRKDDSLAQAITLISCHITIDKMVQVERAASELTEEEKERMESVASEVINKANEYMKNIEDAQKRRN